VLGSARIEALDEAVRDAISRRAGLSAGLPLRTRLFGGVFVGVGVVVGTGVLVLTVAILVQLARAPALTTTPTLTTTPVPTTTPGLTATRPLASLDGDSQAAEAEVLAERASL
jgi:hypothetical protein